MFSATAGRPSSPPGIENPFPGLRPFEKDESDIFFGRDDETYDLLKKLRTVHFLAVLGPSGSGKSSIVRAGLLAALGQGYMADEAPWRTAVLRPGNGPVGQLTLTLLAALQKDGSVDTDEAGKMAVGLRAGTVRIADVVASPPGLDESNVVILVDQFEELFQFVQRAADARAEDDAKVFLRALLEAAGSAASRIYVVITMRSEYLGQCASYPGLPEAINEGLYLVPGMTRSQFREAIVEPIHDAGGSITTALLDRLLNDVNARTDQLPVLQHALMRMWQSHERTQPLGIADYEAVGDLSKCLSNHAEQIYSSLTDSQKSIAGAMFRTITEMTPANRILRHPSPLGVICDIAGVSLESAIPVVDAFRGEGKSFLVTSPGPLTRDSIVDISHEALARQWTTLREWVEQEALARRLQNQLDETAEAWERARADKSYLYRGTQLVEAERYLDARKRRMSGRSSHFLEASQRARRTARTWRITAGVFSLFLLVGMAVWLGYQQVHEQKKQATQQTVQYAQDLSNFANSGNVADLLKLPIPQTTINDLQSRVSRNVKLQVSIHIGDDRQRAAAEEVKSRLEAEGFTVPAIKVGQASETSTVKYFYATDRDGAAKVASILREVTGRAAAPRYIPAVQGSQEKSQSGVLEAWIGEPQARGTPVPPHPTPVDLMTPVQASPPDGVTYDVYPRTTKLVWNPTPGAQTYGVEIDCFHCCSNNQWCADVGRPFRVVRDLTQTDYTFDFVGAQPGRWRVWAVYASGQESQKSPWRGFTYTK
jgi:hypothetical protein